MKPPTMKGNHEFITVHLTPPVCGGRRKRGEHPRQNHSEPKPARHRAGLRNGHSARVTGAGQAFTHTGSAALAKFRRRTRPDVGGRMEPRPLNFIAAACGGNLVSGDERLLVRRICTDSRQVQAGDLFIALPGDRFDGHDFLGEVLRKGAAALMVRHGRAPASPNSASIITVADTRKALGRLAASYRVDFRLPVVAVAGSNGKTTTKDLIASVLKQRFPTLFSEASFNNDIGVPMTLLRLEQTHQAAVLEAGTNHPGELAQLLEMIRPRFGVLTSIGREHLEFFGDLAGVAEEEGWIAELRTAREHPSCVRVLEPATTTAQAALGWIIRARPSLYRRRRLSSAASTGLIFWGAIRFRMPCTRSRWEPSLDCVPPKFDVGLRSAGRQRCACNYGN
jgi:hypothetical protein